MIPSGIFSGNDVILGNGMVINPKALLEEMKYLNDANISTDKIMISDRAHVILPYHLEIDEIQETRRGANNIGTTKKELDLHMSTNMNGWESVWVNSLMRII